MAPDNRLPHHVALSISGLGGSGGSKQQDHHRTTKTRKVLSCIDWKKGLWKDFIMTFIILLAHSIFFGVVQWGKRDPDADIWGDYGFKIFGQATDCEQLRHERLGWSLVVNILATLISILSGATLGALSAPSRDQLDECHKDMNYMEIGIQSVHDIMKPYLGWRKRVLWVMLMFFAMPFHLLYNSVIVLSIPATESYQVTLSDAFFNLDRSEVQKNGLFNLTSTIDNSGGEEVPCPTAVTTVLTSLPSGISIQNNVDKTCNRWAIAPCGQKLPCEQFVADIQKLIPSFTTDKLSTWNPDVKISADNQICEGFFGNYAYCVGLSSSTPRARSEVTSTKYNLERHIYVRDNEISPSNLTTVNQLLLKEGEDLKDKNTAYEMSPYFAWKHHKTSPLQDYMNSSNWTGLSVASKDLESLLLNTRRNPNPTSNKIFGGLEASSPDWSLLLLNECLDTFSTRYRSYAGTVVLVVSGAGSNTTSNMILGLSYLTNRVESLGVVCPTYFIDQTPGGTEIVARENPPALPLIFETLGCGHGGSCRKGSALFKKSELCPWKYEGVREYDPVEIPSAQFCALRVRGSKCRLGYNTVFFMTIVVSLGIKLVLLALAILAVQERPLLTVGDAVEEYLENEDLSTIGCSLEWTAERGLECTGPLRSYNDKEQHHDVLEGVSGPKVPKPQIGSEHSKFLADRRHWWREIWPLKGDARKESVPKWDIINYSASMKSWDRVWWIMLHIFTLGVCTGIFTSIALQKGWTEAPKQSAGPRDVMWMIRPAFFVNLPQLFATIRAFADIKILTSRNSIQEFAGYVTAAQGLRVSHAEKGTAQRDGYYFGNMNFLVYITLIGLQTLYSFILSQLVIPQWVNPLDPSKADDYFSPAFHMRFGSLSSRSHGHNAVIIFFIAFFPLIGVHVINTASSFVVRVRVLKISELSTFIPQYLFDIFFIPAKLRPGKGDVIETTHRLPSIPLQMPGPATNSLVLSVACHPHPSERGTWMSRKPLKWGVVQRPIATSTKLSSTYDLRSPKADQTEVLTISPVRSSTSPPFISLGYGDDWPFKSEQPTLPPRSTTTPFTIKRKALASSYVTEVHSEESALLGAEEKKPPTVGHCTFSALEVDELEPGQLYTGLLRDEYHAMWMRGDSLTVRRILVDFIHRLRWRRNTGR